MTDTQENKTYVKGIYLKSVTANTLIQLDYENCTKSYSYVTVTFDLGAAANVTGVSPSANWSVILPHDSKITEPAKPTCPGKLFKGWKKENASNFWNFSTNTTPGSGSTLKLVAQWVDCYTVTFDMGVCSAAANAPDPVTVESGETVAAPSTAPSCTGYIFKGWYADSAFTSAFDFTQTIAKDTTVYAGWNYVVSFDMGICSSKNVVNAPASVEVEPDGTVSKPDPLPECTGYTLNGWYSDSGYTTKFNFSNETNSNHINAPTTVYAKWTLKQHEVTFHKNTPGSAASETETKTVDYGTRVTEPDISSSDEYTIAGWYTDPNCTDGKEFDFNTPITEDIELYAKWEKNTYTVEFESKYGAAPGTKEIDSGEAIWETEKAMQDENPSLEGYQFLRWYTDEACTAGKEWKYDTKLTKSVLNDADNKTLRLYAKWVFLPAIKFDVTSETENNYDPYFEQKYYATYNESTDTYTWTIQPVNQAADDPSTGDPVWTVWDGKTAPADPPSFDYWYLSRVEKSAPVTVTATGNGTSETIARDYYTYYAPVNAKTSDDGDTASPGIGNTYTIKYSNKLTTQDQIGLDADGKTILVPVPLDSKINDSDYRQDEIVLHPRWEITVTLHWNDASKNNGVETVKTYVVDYGDALPDDVDPGIDGWKIKYWKDKNNQVFEGGRKYLKGMAVTESLELWAEWEISNSFQVNYYPYDPDDTTITDHNQFGGGPMRQQSYPVGTASITLTKNNYTRKGYDFAGKWKGMVGSTAFGEPADGATITFNGDNALKNGESLDLYALWGDAKTYTATFIPEKGKTFASMEDASCDPTEFSFTIEDAIDLPKPERENYVFKGWKVVIPDGKTSEYYKDTAWADAADKITYTAETIGAGKWGDVTFEAQWEKVPGVEVTVHGDEIDNTNVSADATRKNRLTADIAIPAFESKGTSYSVAVNVYELDENGSIVEGAMDTITTDVNGNSLTYSGEAMNATVLLDSMETGKQFKDICPHIAPGANIKVECVLTCTAGRATSYKRDSEITNSLFGYDRSGTVTNSASVAKIAGPRHLQNLGTDYSGVGKAAGSGTSGTAAATASAVLYQDVDWNDQTAGEEKTYRPVSNPGLTLFSGADPAGKVHTISNITVTSETGNAGLFDTVSGSMTVKSLTLSACSFEADVAGGIAAEVSVGGGLTVDGVSFKNGCSVKAAGAKYVYAGGIAGLAEGSLTLQNSVSLDGYTISAETGSKETAAGAVAGKCDGTLTFSSGSTLISKCTVTVDGKDSNGGTVAGKLTGSATIQNVSVNASSVTVIGGSAGGVAGTASGGANITSVYIDETSVSATKGNAGGVIGTSSGTVNLNTVLVTSGNKSVTANSSGSAGGLIGKDESGATISNSSASMLVTAADDAGGLVGKHTGGTLKISNSYAGGHTVNGYAKYVVDGVTETYNINGGGNAGGLVGCTSGTKLDLERTFSSASVSGADAAGGAVGLLKSDDAQLYLVYVLGKVKDVPVTNANNSYTSATHAALIGCLGNQYNAGHQVVVTDDSGASKCFYLAEVYNGFSYKSAEGIDMATVAYVGGYDPADVDTDGAIVKPDPLSGIVRLAYYQSTGEVATELKTTSSVISVNSYDSKLRTYDYPYRIWSTVKKSGSTGNYALYGDWQPVMNPAVEPIKLSFMYVHPGMNKAVNEAIPTVLRTQDILRNNDNTVIVPDTPNFKLYDSFVWKLCRYDSETKQYVPIEGKDTYTEDGGVIRILAKDATEDLYVIKYYQRNEGTEDQSVIFFMYNPSSDPTADTPLDEYRDLGQIAVTTGETTYKQISTESPYKESYENMEKEILGYYFVGWFDADGNLVDLKNDSSTKVTGDMVLYAKYSENAYYDVTVNFVYQIGDSGERPSVTNVSRISGSRSSYKLTVPTGESKTVTVTVPKFADYPITKIYAYNMSDTDTVNTIKSVPEVTGDPSEVACTRGDDKKMTAESKVSLTVNSESNFMVVYCVEPQTPFVVRYVMGNTAADGSYAAGNTAGKTLYYTDDASKNYITTDVTQCKIFYTLNSTGDGVSSFIHNNPEGFYSTCDEDKLQYCKSDTNSSGYEEVTLTVDGENVTCRVVELSYDRRQYIAEYNYNGGSAATDESGNRIYALRYYYGQPIAVPVAENDYSEGNASQIKTSTMTSMPGYALSPSAPWQITCTETKDDGTTETTSYQAGDRMPAGKVVVKANWVTAKSDFKVVYMFENPEKDDNGYSYYKTYPETGAYEADTESWVRASDYSNLASGDSYAQHFNFVSDPGIEGYQSSVQVSADGSTVLTVYFKRQTHTVKWYGSSATKTVTGKYGQDVSSEWPSDTADPNNTPDPNKNTSWKVGSRNSNIYQANIGILDKDYAFYYTSQGQALGYYYLEVLDTDRNDPNKTYIKYPNTNSAYYVLDHTDTGFGTNFYITTDDTYPIQGFTFTALKTKGGSVATTASQISSNRYTYHGTSFYYLRNDYTLDFAVGYPSNISTEYSETVQFEAPLGNYNEEEKVNEIAEKLLGAELMTHYDFEGWYEDPECTKKFEFTDSEGNNSVTMPYNNLKLYGKWVGKWQKVTLQLDSGKNEKFPDGTTRKVILCRYGETIEKTIQEAQYQPVREGYTFNYWSKTTDLTEPFSVSEPIINDITLYPGSWMQDVVTEKRTITVYHVVSGTKEEIASPVTVEGYVGEVVPLTAVTSDHWIPKLLGSYYKVPAKDEQADPLTYTFYYDEPEVWNYTLNYKITYESQIKDLSQISEDVRAAVGAEGTLNTDENGKSYLLSSESKNADRQYEIVEAKLPDTLSGYKVTGYRYYFKPNDGGAVTEIDPPTNKTVAAISPLDGTQKDADDNVLKTEDGSLILEFSVEPDYDNLTMEDLNVLYNAKDRSGTMIPNEQFIPEAGSGSEITSIDPMIFVKTKDGTEAKEVGMYSVQGYYLIKVVTKSDGTDVFMISKANAEEYLNLKIRQRTYHFLSGSGSVKTGSNSLLENLTVTITGDIIDPEGAKAFISANGGVLYFEDLTGSEDKTEEEKKKTAEVNALFFPEGEGFNIYSSIESFRKTPGVIQNIFKVTPKSSDYENNYVMTSEYGTLTVQWQYEVEIWHVDQVDQDGKISGEAIAKYLFEKKTNFTSGVNPVTLSYEKIAAGTEFEGDYEAVNYTYWLRDYTITRDDEGNVTNVTVNSPEAEQEGLAGSGDEVTIESDENKYVCIKYFVTEKPLMVLQTADAMLGVNPDGEPYAADENGQPGDENLEQTDSGIIETDTGFVEGEEAQTQDEAESEEISSDSVSDESETSSENAADSESSESGTNGTETETEAKETAESENNGTETDSENGTDGEPETEHAPDGETGSETESAGEGSEETSEEDHGESSEENSEESTAESSGENSESGSEAGSGEPTGDETGEGSEVQSEPAEEEPALSEEELIRLAEEQAEEEARLMEEEAIALEAQIEEELRIYDEILASLENVNVVKCKASDYDTLSGLFGDNGSLANSLTYQDDLTAQFWSVEREEGAAEPLTVPYGSSIYLRVENLEDWINPGIPDGVPFTILGLRDSGGALYLSVTADRDLIAGTGELTLTTNITVGETIADMPTTVLSTAIEVTAN